MCKAGWVLPRAPLLVEFLHSESFDTVACVAGGFFCVFSFVVLKFEEIQPRES